MIRILAYEIRPARYHDYDPRVVEVAATVASFIRDAAPWLQAEHIGSTAVPGCAGKGIVDMMVLYPPGKLDAARNVVDGLGFQRQQTGHIFPEERPMRVGAIEVGSEIYRLHVHILDTTAQEVADLRHFRDVLCTDKALCAAYQAKKRAILEAGLSEPLGYTKAKGEFINAILEKRTA